jgi:hypothetical protein
MSGHSVREGSPNSGLETVMGSSGAAASKLWPRGTSPRGRSRGDGPGVRCRRLCAEGVGPRHQTQAGSQSRPGAQIAGTLGHRTGRAKAVTTGRQATELVVHLDEMLASSLLVQAGTTTLID